MVSISATERARRDQRHAIADGLLDGLIRDLAQDFARLHAEGDPLDPADDFVEVERLILGAANGQPVGGVRVLSAICAAAVLRLARAVKEARPAPLPDRLRAAADAITELNSMQGYTADAAQRAGVSAMFLRHEAEVLEER